MSSAKRRGQARGQAPADARGGGRRRGNPARGRVAPFDGPASRGSQSGAGTQPQISHPAPSSQPPSDAGPQDPTQGSAAGSQPAAPGAAAPRDPARDPVNIPRATDAIRNVDMPGSFYNIDGLVCSKYFFPIQHPRITDLPHVSCLHRALRLVM